MLNGQRIMVKQAEMKSQKHKLPLNEQQDTASDEPMNKSIITKYKIQVT